MKASRPLHTTLGFLGVCTLCLIALAGLSLFVSCATVSSFGKDRTLEQRQRYATSPNFDDNMGHFLNLHEPVLDSFWTANSRRFRAGVNTSYDGPPPDFKLPMEKPDFKTFSANDTGLKAIWIGHSSLAIRMDSVTILTDPIFGRASPFSFYKSPRFQPPVVTREQLPDVDFIVISHEHYDHLERETVEFYAKKNTTFIVPLGISSHLLYWGVKKERIVERDWWESVTLKGITFTATPAWHSSGRRKRGHNHTQWASWVVRSDRHKVYFTGDTGYGRHLKMIGDQFGPFDVVFLENGQYSRAWRSHMQPQHWPLAMRDLKSTTWFSIHWGTFSLAPHAWDDPIKAADSISRQNGFRLIAPKMGAVVDLENPPELVRWWIKPTAKP
jgi:L-ascorbate metabolism protein UlaG (beta-lactamase superfamily)